MSAAAPPTPGPSPSASVPSPQDRPLQGRPAPGTWHPRLYAAEFIGTLLLVLVGVSAVILMFSDKGPVPALIPSLGARHLITGFLFGLTGALVTVSGVGRVSGAHLNPSVTLAFLIEGKIRPRDAFGYVGAQLAGGLLGGLPLALWSDIGRAASYGDTQPGPDGLAAAFLGEMWCTAALVTLIFVMTARKATRAWTPWSIAPLFSVLVWAEADVSGTSTNLARTLGPNLLAGAADVLWLYLLAPLAGAALAAWLLRSEVLGRFHPPAARVGHFEQELLGEFDHLRGLSYTRPHDDHP